MNKCIFKFMLFFETMKIFEYSSTNIEKTFDSNGKNESEFDQTLLNEWNRLMNTDGVFKFKLEPVLPTRILSGKYGLIVQASY